MSDLLYAILKKYCKNRAVIKINYFPFCKARGGRDLALAAREVRKQASYAVPECHLVICSCLDALSLLCSSAVLSPSSSIKLSHILR